MGVKSPILYQIEVLEGNKEIHGFKKKLCQSENFLQKLEEL